MRDRIAWFGTVLLLVVTAGIGSLARAENWEKATEEQRRAWNREYDRHGLYGKKGMVTDTSRKFLRASRVLASEWPEGMTVAKVPPIIEFAPVRGIDPMYFPEDNKSLWTNWGSVTLAPNGRFYFAEGDHRGKDSHVYLWEYDPEAHDCVRMIDFGKLCGWDRLGVGDSKIHGDMGITSDGIMWILNYWDPDPKPTPEIEAIWPGSHLVRFDTNTGEARDFGVLIPKAGWPQYQFDPERGILFAVSFRSEVLCYHVSERRVSYFGFPPPRGSLGTIGAPSSIPKPASSGAGPWTPRRIS